MRKREFAWLMTLRDERGGDRINRAKVALIGAGDTDLQKRGGFNVIPKRTIPTKTFCQMNYVCRTISALINRSAVGILSRIPSPFKPLPSPLLIYFPLPSSLTRPIPIAALPFLLLFPSFACVVKKGRKEKESYKAKTVWLNDLSSEPPHAITSAGHFLATLISPSHKIAINSAHLLVYVAPAPPVELLEGLRAQQALLRLLLLEEQQAGAGDERLSAIWLIESNNIYIIFASVLPPSPPSFWSLPPPPFSPFSPPFRPWLDAPPPSGAGTK